MAQGAAAAACAGEATLAQNSQQQSGVANPKAGATAAHDAAAAAAGVQPASVWGPGEPAAAAATPVQLQAGTPSGLTVKDVSAEKSVLRRALTKWVQASGVAGVPSSVCIAELLPHYASLLLLLEQQHSRKQLAASTLYLTLSALCNFLRSHQQVFAGSRVDFSAMLISIGAATNKYRRQSQRQGELTSPGGSNTTLTASATTAAVPAALRHRGLVSTAAAAAAAAAAADLVGIAGRNTMLTASVATAAVPASLGHRVSDNAAGAATAAAAAAAGGDATASLAAPTAAKGTAPAAAGGSTSLAAAAAPAAAATAAAAAAAAVGCGQAANPESSIAGPPSSWTIRDVSAVNSKLRSVLLRWAQASGIAAKRMRSSVRVAELLPHYTSLLSLLNDRHSSDQLSTSTLYVELCAVCRFLKDHQQALQSSCENYAAIFNIAAEQHVQSTQQVLASTVPGPSFKGCGR